MEAADARTDNARTSADHLAQGRNALESRLKDQNTQIDRLQRELGQEIAVKNEAENRAKVAFEAQLEANKLIHATNIERGNALHQKFQVKHDYEDLKKQFDSLKAALTIQNQELNTLFNQLKVSLPSTNPTTDESN